MKKNDPNKEAHSFAAVFTKNASQKIILTFTLLVLIAAVTFVACNKKDASSLPGQTKEARQAAFIQDYIAKHPQFTVIPSAQQMDVYTADGAGAIIKKLNPRQGIHPVPGGVTGSCYPIFPPAAKLVSQWFATPGCTDYTFKVSIAVYSVNPVVSVSPYNPAIKTRGYLRITNAAGTANLYLNGNITVAAGDIVNNGTAAATADGHPGTIKFTITWVVTGVPSSAVTGGGTMWMSTYFVTNCLDEMNPNYFDPNTGATGTTNYLASPMQPSLANAGSYTACDIICPVTLITPTMYGGSFYGTMTGAAAGTCTPSRMPTYQKVIFYNHGSTSVLWSYLLPPTATFTFSPGSITPFPFVTGNLYDFQYQNVVTGTGACTGPLSALQTVTW